MKEVRTHMRLKKYFKFVQEIRSNVTYISTNNSTGSVQKHFRLIESKIYKPKAKPQEGINRLKNDRKVAESSGTSNMQLDWVTSVHSTIKRKLKGTESLFKETMVESDLYLEPDIQEALEF